jgi:phenylalanyl-tRNA synthetase beta subunit
VQPAQTFPTLGAVDIYRNEDEPDCKRITLRLTIASYEKTMTDKEVTAMLGAVAAAAHQRFGAELI